MKIEKNLLGNRSNFKIFSQTNFVKVKVKAEVILNSDNFYKISKTLLYKFSSSISTLSIKNVHCEMIQLNLYVNIEIIH